MKRLFGNGRDPSCARFFADSGIRIFGVLLAMLVALAAIAQPGAPPSEAPAAPPAGQPGAMAAPGQAAPAARPAGVQSLSALTAQMLGNTVGVVGKITNKVAPTGTAGRAPYRWYVSDGEGVALVVIFPDQYGQLPNPDQTFPVGALVQVKGKVQEYRGQLQVVPDAASDVRVAAADTAMGLWPVAGAAGPAAQAPAAAAAPAPAAPGAAAAAALPAEPPAGDLFPGKVTREQLDKTIKVLGKVSNFRSSWSATAPNILTLEGGGGTLDCVFWKEVNDALGDRRAQISTTGQLVEAEGRLAEYRNRLQLRIENAAQLNVWSGAGAAATAPSMPAAPAPGGPAPVGPNIGRPPEPAPAQPAVPAAPPSIATSVVTPSQITRADIGKTVVVNGTVQSVRPPANDRAPIRVALADDKGSISVVYWKDNEAQFTGDNAPQVGKAWKIEGTVGEFRNELQLRARAAVK